MTREKTRDPRMKPATHEPRPANETRDFEFALSFGSLC